MSTVAATAPDPLVVRTTPLADSRPLIDLLPGDDPVTWLRRGEGLVGWGTAKSVRIAGAARFTDAAAWWSALCARSVVRDEVGVPGTGLVAFGSFAFADEPGTSVLRVPEVVVGRRAGTTWVTTVSSRGTLSPVPDIAAAPPRQSPRGLVFADGVRSGAGWAAAVRAATALIGEGRLDKVVLAHDLVADVAGDLDVRWPLARLALDYPACWTFHVDGLFGATPEMLVRREKGLVTSRVLAGTIQRTGDDAHDLALAASLARSSKDLEEHEYAVRSLAQALSPHCSSMNVPETPSVLHLPNVMHLSTDVAAVLADDTSVLDLAAALHPTAAVCGTPTSAALRTIAELEGLDRGRYAGPVGWLDAQGDGEWGIALRCGAVTGNQVRLFAGCGIVAGSDPETELTEAQAKFVPVRDALAPA